MKLKNVTPADLSNEEIRKDSNKSLKFSSKRRLGNKGEDLATIYLQNLGFKIIVRNWLRRIGEIDIIAERLGVIHFVEVKSMFRQTSNSFGDYRAEESVGTQKKLHMKQAVKLFIIENDLYEAKIKIDLITVTFYRDGEIPRLSYLENIIL